MGRVLIFAYGVLCYAIGMAALVYFILFSVGLFVPKTVDTGVAGAVAPAIAINLALFALFGLQHSIMARKGFKAAWTKVVPEPAERSTYLVATALVVAALVYFWQPLPGAIWSVENETLRMALYAVALGGWGFTAACSFLTDHFDLFGLRQVWLNLRGTPYTPPKFKAILVYNKMRHPMMTGIMLGVWVTPEMTVSHLFFAAAATVYILIGVAYEERDLISDFGDSYTKYKSTTSAYLPLPGKK
jgi:protein-S-isoprenylcysteine O-methyltransferase Ste14